MIIDSNELIPSSKLANKNNLLEVEVILFLPIVLKTFKSEKVESIRFFFIDLVMIFSANGTDSSCATFASSFPTALIQSFTLTSFPATSNSF